ncbi:RNA degradosome polyphosphate kinase [Acidihalobacter aeolianus]|uniref:Polyphosphate kinase n=1 Tax=Acidihalobacter aeolianus TaxID=2792603 RepID=A0A1D8K9U3_9GAMM|nr:polyphosphate kinase 1 [Acidihalobacter aeolianus]AOV17714.1 RNA degradosome polyphosphate kinase [Acidihalobacter aeolianus]
MPAPETEIDLSAKDLYINRELSLLEFNGRVLEMAKDASMPLLERLRFLCISSTNLDEFFEIRVSGIKQQLSLGVSTPGADGLSAAEQFERISAQAHTLVDDQYRTFNEMLVPELAEQGIRFVRRTHWNAEQADWIKRYFNRELLPVLSPLGLDPSHPFPRTLNKSLNFVVTLEGKDAFGRDSGLAIVQAPRSLPRLIRLPDEIARSQYGFVFLSSIIHAHVGDLFPGMRVTGCYQFRVTRNSDLFVDEEEIDDLLHALEGELPSRNFGEAVRLEVADNCTAHSAEYLLQEFGLGPADVYQVNGPVNLNRLLAVVDLVDRPDLKFQPFTPVLPAVLQPGDNYFDALDKGDVLLHHPYESFNPVIEFIRQAARDPAVLAIKQTLYRTGAGSRIVGLLVEAARAGKEVTVVVELRARFDEAANIELASHLQDAGAHVLYGVVGYKTHAKMAMVVRRHKGRLRRYVHLGTGNYHAGTARAYTDFGLFTADRVIGEDVHKIFQQLTGLGRVSRPKKLLQAPFSLHKGILTRINREAAAAREKRPARIIARMNALIDPQIIQALYQASRAGVQIDLIVRGVCCLRPGLPGVSENIRVRSVLGRFLEHSRVFYFQNDGNEPEVFCSSADWMPRNFFRRVESAFPIEDRKLAQRVIHEGLELYLKDNSLAWTLQPDGSYHRSGNDRQKPRPAQGVLLQQINGIELS